MIGFVHKAAGGRLPGRAAHATSGRAIKKLPEFGPVPAHIDLQDGGDRFHEEGIVFPFPQRVIHFAKDGAARGPDAGAAQGFAREAPGGD